MNFARWRFAPPSAPQKEYDRIEALIRDESPQAYAYRDALEALDLPLVPDGSADRLDALRRALEECDRRKDRAETRLRAEQERRSRYGAGVVSDNKLAWLEAEVEKWEALASRLWPHAHPALIDGHGYSAPVPATCKTNGCSNVVPEAEAFEKMGHCGECWAVATGQKPPARPVDPDVAAVERLLSPFPS